MTNDSWVKDYENVFGADRMRWTLAALKEFRIRKRDWRDWVQELVMLLMEFRYDPQTATVPEMTALRDAIKAYIKEYRRSNAPPWPADQAACPAAGHDRRAGEVCRWAVYEESTGLRMDVREMIAKLPPFEREVCLGLMNGQRRNAIATRLNTDSPLCQRGGQAYPAAVPQSGARRLAPKSRLRRGPMSTPETTTAPALLTVDDLANLLRCSRRTVYRLADAGRVPPPCRLGGLVRWNRRRSRHGSPPAARHPATRRRTGIVDSIPLAVGGTFGPVCPTSRKCSLR